MAMRKGFARRRLQGAVVGWLHAERVRRNQSGMSCMRERERGRSKGQKKRKGSQARHGVGCGRRHGDRQSKCKTRV